MTWGGGGCSAVKAILMKYHLLRNVVGNILKLRAPKIYIFKKKTHTQKTKKKKKKKKNKKKKKKKKTEFS